MTERVIEIIKKRLLNAEDRGVRIEDGLLYGEKVNFNNPDEARLAFNFLMLVYKENQFPHIM